MHISVKLIEDINIEKQNKKKPKVLVTFPQANLCDDISGNSNLSFTVPKFKALKLGNIIS